MSAQAFPCSFVAVREPSFTSCPQATSFEPIVWPTIPVPNTPNFIAVPPKILRATCCADAGQRGFDAPRDKPSRGHIQGDEKVIMGKTCSGLDFDQVFRAAELAADAEAVPGFVGAGVDFELSAVTVRDRMATCQFAGARLRGGSKKSLANLTGILSSCGNLARRGQAAEPASLTDRVLVGGALQESTQLRFSIEGPRRLRL